MEKPFVLIVDDESITQNTLTTHLQAIGFQTSALGEGKAVLAACHLTVPDLILLSVSLPDVDGLAVCNQLHNDTATSHIPIICLTVSAEQSLKIKALSAGAVDCLVKPIDPEELKVRVWQWLALHKEWRQLINQVANKDVQQSDLAHSLANTRNYYAHLLNGLHDQVIIFDQNYQVIEVNEPMLQQTGRQRQEVLGMYCYQVNHHLEVPCWLHKEHPCPARQMWETKEAQRATHIHYDKFGTPMYVEVVCSPLFNDEGKLVGAIEACRDLSHEQQLEQRLKAVYQLGQELTLLQQETAVIHRVLEMAADLLGDKTISYGYIDNENNQLIYAGAYCSPERDFVRLNIQLPLSENKGIGVAVYQSGKALRIPNLRQELPTNSSTYPYLSAMCVPMHVQERIVGVLTAESEKVADFSDDDQQLLQALADYAGIAIENARLHEQTQKELAERRQTETRLRQLSAVVEQGPVIVVITNLQGDIEYVNPKFTEVTGYTAVEVQGKNPHMFKSDNTSAEEYKQLWDTISQGKEWRGELYNHKKDGSPYWEFASISPLFNDEQEITHFIAVKEEITQQKEVRENLRLRNQELQTLYRIGQMLNSSLDLTQVLRQFLNEVQDLLQVVACSVWLLDGDTGEMVCEEATEPRRSDVKGWRLHPGAGLVGWVMENGRSLIVNNVTQDPRHYPHVDQKTGLNLRSILSVPLRIQQKTIGVFQMVDEIANRFTLRDQQFAESLATVAGHAIENARLHTHLQQQLDLLKSTRDRLMRSEKLAAVGELVASIAHELNNPLAAIVLHAQLLQTSGLPEEFNQDIQQVVAQTRRARKIVQSLLDFSRQRPPERHALQINDLLRSTLDLLNYELYTHNIQVITQFANDVPMIWADQYQLQQVFVNLIHNARQAMTEAHEQGKLSVFTMVGPSRFVADDPQPRQVLRVIIQDDGNGVPLAMQSRIFDPFFTTKKPGEGTGLGLSVCYGIIAEHDGHIWVESKPGEGARFIVELPIEAQEEGDEDAARLETAVSPTQDTVQLLLIDDEETILDIVQHILQQHEYQVQTAHSAEEAIELLRQKSFDLILCDLNLPGMNGQELYEHLSATHPQQACPFILLTGDSISWQTQHFLAINRLPYIYKPFDIEQLIRLVQAQLGNLYVNQ